MVAIDHIHEDHHHEDSLFNKFTQRCAYMEGNANSLNRTEERDQMQTLIGSITTVVKKWLVVRADWNELFLRIPDIVSF